MPFGISSTIWPIPLDFSFSFDMMPFGLTSRPFPPYSPPHSPPQSSLHSPAGFPQDFSIPSLPPQAENPPTLLPKRALSNSPSSSVPSEISPDPLTPLWFRQRPFPWFLPKPSPSSSSSPPINLPTSSNPHGFDFNFFPSTSPSSAAKSNEERNEGERKEEKHVGVHFSGKKENGVRRNVIFLFLVF